MLILKSIFTLKYFIKNYLVLKESRKTWTVTFLAFIKVTMLQVKIPSNIGSDKQTMVTIIKIKTT